MRCTLETHFFLIHIILLPLDRSCTTKVIPVCTYPRTYMSRQHFGIIISGQLQSCLRYLDEILLDHSSIVFFPDTSIDLINFNHSSATTILSYMRLSFPHFKDDLEQTMTLPSLTGRAKIDLTNLWHLLNYFIPVVQCKYDSVTSCFLVHTFVHPFKQCSDILY